MPHRRGQNRASIGLAALLVAGCATPPPAPSDAVACSALVVTIPALAIDPPSRDARPKPSSSTLPDERSRGGASGSGHAAALPRDWEIAPLDPSAPMIRFRESPGSGTAAVQLAAVASTAC
jgi:hypothetical protein